MNATGPSDIQLWTPPLDTSQAGELAALLQHKGSPWIEDLRRRMAGTIPGSSDCFYVARDGRQLVGHAWYTVADSDPCLGLVGHIFTHPDYRRRGIARQLLQQVQRDFTRRGGSVLQLFSSTPHSIPLYEQLGFETVFSDQAYHATDWYMRYPSPSAALLDAWYGAREVLPATQRLTRADLPYYCLLYNIEHRTAVKDRAQRIGSGVEAELAFLESTTALAAGQGICTVLRNDTVMLGTATLMKSLFPYESHIAIFDCYVHAAFRQHAVALAEACLAARREVGAEIVYAIVADAAKRALLSDVGFVHHSNLPGHYRVSHQCLAAELLRWP